MAFDPDEYLGITTAEQPSGEFDPNAYLELTPEQAAETERYGEPLSEEQRAATKTQGPPIAPEGMTAAEEAAAFAAKYPEPPWMKETPGQRAVANVTGALKDVFGPPEPWTESAFPLQRPFAQQEGVIPQIAAGLGNLPADLWNFATSPMGVALGGVDIIGPLASRALAAGFTVDMITHGLEAGTLQEQVGAAAGAALGAHGAIHPKPYEAPRTKTTAGLEPIAPETQFPSVGAEPTTGVKPSREEIGISPGAPPPPEFDPDAYLKGEEQPTKEAPPETQAVVEQTNTALENAANAQPGTTISNVVDTATKDLPETDTAPAGAGDVVKVPSNQIATRPDLMQFKRMTDEGTGTNPDDYIDTTYDPIKAGNLLLWEPINPKEHGLTGDEKYIVANGHHRNAAATEQGIETQNAQILRESAGISATDARIAAAEANIADGKGTIYDQANFIRGQAETAGADEALGRARQIGARGRKAATIALNSTPDLYTSFINEQITPEATAAIADAAPHNEGLQRLGLQRALKGDDPQAIQNFLQAVQANVGNRAPGAEQVDLFGTDDTAIKTAEDAAKRAGAIQKELGEQINAVAGATKRPEKAAALGVNISDPAAVAAKLASLRALRERARNWALDPQLRDTILSGELSPEEAIKAMSERPAPEAGEAAAPSVRVPTTREKQIAKMTQRFMETGMSFDEAVKRSTMGRENVRFDLIRELAEAPMRKQVDLFQGEDKPFNLFGETAEEFQRRLKEREDAEQRTRDAQAKADSVQRDLFGEMAAPEPTVLGHERPEPEAPRPPPEDDPKFTNLPADLPEAVSFAHDLLGTAIQVKRKLKALQGRAAGIFRYGPRLGKGEIHLRADIADLLSASDKAQLREEAQAYAERMSDNKREQGDIAQARYEYLLDKAYEEAKRKPPLMALKVIWHEIGHAVDYLPHKIFEGRGNLFGHIAALKNYLKGAIALDPTKPPGWSGKEGKMPTRAESEKMKIDAEKQLRKEMGPIAEVVDTIRTEEPILRIVGIEPQDVKNLFGMDARESMPQLYKWFAEQTAAVKKEIVRKAMQGVLDERLKALGKSEVIGTRTVERTVRRKVGREPTAEEIQERFRKLFREELIRRNLAELNAVKDELKKSIAWYHGTDEMPPYYGTASEMYAEAFSIFMNNPAALAKRAPTYMRLINNYMDARPEVADLYNKLQNEIKSGQVADRTEARMLDGWDAADKAALEEARRKTTQKGDFLDNVFYHMDRRMGPIYKAAKGAEREGAVRAAVGNFLYRTSEHELILKRLNNEVSKPIVDANLDAKDIGRYMLYKRIIEERYKIFNPGGVAPDRALNRLENLKNSLGPVRFQKLEDAWAAMRKIYEERVLTPEMRRMWSPELQAAIDKNVNYATFDVRQEQGTTEDGISRFLKSRFGNAGPTIYRQVGTVRDIKNPFTATVMKMLSLTSATARNTVRRETIRVLQEADPHNVVEARKRWTGKYMENVPVENDKVGTVSYMENGKLNSFYVRRVVADALNQGNHIENGFSRVLSPLYKGSNLLKSLFTQLNYAFWPVNFMRDTMGWVMQVPGATPVDWLREAPKSFQAARASVKGTPNPSADAALARRMVISRGDPRGIWSAAENEFEVQLASYGVDPARWAKQGENVNAVVKAWNSYRELGQMVERVNKISAMNYLDRTHPDMPEWKKAEIVRERGGSPDFLQRGASNPMVDLLWMFYNPWKEGLRSVTAAARENPFSFAAKSTAFVALPTTLQVLAASGALGQNKEKQYASIPNYDLSNYLVIPLFWADQKQGKVAYLRLPLWEPARIMHMTLWNALTGRAGQVGEQLLKFYGGTFPSQNAMFSTLGMWMNYEIMGQNPVDTYRGKPILDDATYKAGGWLARKELLKQSWNNMGGAIVHRFQNQYLDDPPQTGVEKFLQLPVVNNALGRWLKVSSRGIAEADNRLIADDEQARASTQKAVQEIERKILNQEGLNQSEKLLLRDPYAMQYLTRTLGEHTMSQEVPMFRRLQGKTPEQKLMILEQMNKGR
jgi:hypothetical protein